MFGLVIDPRLATHPRFRKNPTLPHQGLVWQCRVTRRCRVRVWFGVASLLCPMSRRVWIPTSDKREKKYIELVVAVGQNKKRRRIVGDDRMYLRADWARGLVFLLSTLRERSYSAQTFGSQFLVHMPLIAEPSAQDPLHEGIEWLDRGSIGRHECHLQDYK